MTLWYEGSGGTQEDVGANAVFTGVLAGREGSLNGDRLPVVFISHGGLRSAANSGAWLAAALSRAGYLSIEINAPRPATAADAVDEIWRRPDDVSRALDALLSDSIWSEHIDQDRIFVAGFALGGTAALALGGGNFEPQSFVQSCDGAVNGPDCGWYNAQNITLGSVDLEELAEARRDPRITSVVAVAPEYLDVFSVGLTSLEVPSLVVALGGDDAQYASALAAGVTVVQVPAANVFDGFQTCTPAGPEILAEDGGDPAVCGLSAEARQQVHDAIASEIVSFIEAEQ